MPIDAPSEVLPDQGLEITLAFSSDDDFEGDVFDHLSESGISPHLLPSERSLEELLPIAVPAVVIAWSGAVRSVVTTLTWIRRRLTTGCVVQVVGSTVHVEASGKLPRGVTVLVDADGHIAILDANESDSISAKVFAAVLGSKGAG